MSRIIKKSCEIEHFPLKFCCCQTVLINSELKLPTNSLHLLASNVQSKPVFLDTMFGGGGGGRKKEEKPRRDRGGRGQMPLLMGVPGMEDNLDAMLEDDTELEAELAALVGGGGGGGRGGGKGAKEAAGKRGGGEVDLDAMVASCMKDYGSGDKSIESFPIHLQLSSFDGFYHPYLQETSLVTQRTPIC